MSDIENQINYQSLKGLDKWVYDRMPYLFQRQQEEKTVEEITVVPSSPEDEEEVVLEEEKLENPSRQTV